MIDPPDIAAAARTAFVDPILAPAWLLLAAVAVAFLVGWSIGRSERRCRPGHHGHEHPLGSEPNCPGCADWRSRRPTRPDR
jgi:hypothetical protein